MLRFARETGDLHALSSADVKLLALAHTLEVATHGSAHLREHPIQVRGDSKLLLAAWFLLACFCMYNI